MPPLVLDGSAGVSGVDGTASNPSLEGTDSNTGVFFPAADTVAIGTNGTEALRVTSAQAVGVGTTSPQKKFVVSNSGAAGVELDPFTRSATTGASLLAYNRSGAAFVRMDYDASQHLFFLSGSQAMTLDANGNLGIGTTTLNQKLNIYGDGINYSALINFDRGGVYTAQIGTDGAGAIFGSTSNHLTRFITNNTERARITSGGILSLQSSTANGVYLQSAADFSMASNATVAITSFTAGACLILVYEPATGDGGMFWANFTAAVTKVAGDGSATDAGSTFAVYKSAAGHTTTIKNRYGVSKNFRIAVYSAQANP